MTLAESVSMAQKGLETLETHAQTTHDELSAFHHQFDALADVVDKLNDLQKHIQDASHELEAMESKAEERVHQLTASLDQLVSSLHEQVENATAEVTEYESFIEQTIQAAQENKSNREEHDQNAHDKLTALREALDEATGHVDEQVANSSTALEQLDSEADNFTQTLQDLLDEITQSVADFEDHIAQRIQEFEDSAEQFIQTLGEGLEEMVNTAGDHAHQASTDIEQMLSGDFLGQMEELAGMLNDGLQAVEDYLEKPLDILDGQVGDILDKVHEAMELFDTIKPILEMCEGIPL